MKGNRDKQLSLVELAAYGYDSARVKEGSWLGKTFGNKSRGVSDDEHIRRFDKDQDVRTGRRSH